MAGENWWLEQFLERLLDWHGEDEFWEAVRNVEKRRKGQLTSNRESVACVGCSTVKEQ